MEAVTGHEDKEGRTVPGMLWKISAPPETVTMERLNTRNNTMPSNLIYTRDGDSALRTNKSVRTQGNRTEGEALTFTIATSF